MSINTTSFALSLALALVACSSDRQAGDAGADAQAATAQHAAATSDADTGPQSGNPAAVATRVAPAIPSQEINTPGFTADLVEAQRSDGVLGVKVRLTNTGAKAARIRIYTDTNKIETFYVQAGDKKYQVLDDPDKAAIASPSDQFGGTLSPSVAAGTSYVWWAKYPAPPASVNKFNFYWPLSAPFDDVPITDQ